MGKAYANKKKLEERPKGDFYSTPKSLVWEMKPIILKHFSGPILEPCYGKAAISGELKKWNYKVTENDLYKNGVDYITTNPKEKQVISNPPFSLWDDFVIKAKEHCDTFMFIGRLNYLSTQGRLENKIWENLKSIYIFSRYVDYQTPYREDGLFHVGAMATAWFLWEKDYKKETTTHFIDVQKYAKLGNYKEQ